MDLQKESKKALRTAMGFAKEGDRNLVQIWADRAAQFWPVSKAWVTRLNRALMAARDRMAEEDHLRFMAGEDIN